MTPIDPISLRQHYERFLAPGRVLLTGHSHQAWPDVAREGLVEAFDDAAAHADDKWDRAFAAADAVRDGVVARLGGTREEIALAASTHELVCRFLSALDLRARPRIVTTDGEFHSIRRQLRRMAEASLIDLTVVPVNPVSTLAERVAASITDRTAAVMVSTVLFETSTQVPQLPAIVEAAHRHGAYVLFDAYHAFNSIPFHLSDFRAGPVFVTAGGYKYAQWGEGCAFLRVPPEVRCRPIFTGWFSDFENLERHVRADVVPYGVTGAAQLAGASYDPSSHYRARVVIRFFDAHELTVPRLRAQSLLQTQRILDRLATFDVVTPRDNSRGGFVAVRVAQADLVVAALRADQVVVDCRGGILRIGPAPFVTDDEIAWAVDRITEALARVTRR